jgi:hypothetical protein
VNGLNRDVIKYIAMFTMLLNHIANIFLHPGTILCEALVDIGYFTAPTMCFFLVEGYQYTRSKKKYGQRLLLFALLSEVPFCLAFTRGEVIRFHGWNMLTTLFLCFLILVVKEYVLLRGLRFLAYAILIILTLFCDWPLIAAVSTLLFSCSIGSRKKMLQSYFEIICISAWLFYTNAIWVHSGWGAVWSALASCLGIVLSAVVILFFYNGKRAEWGQTFSKWFFYLFYPGHLLILGCIRLYVEGVIL